jgi:hypothetical protein
LIQIKAPIDGADHTGTVFPDPGIVGRPGQRASKDETMNDLSTIASFISKRPRSGGKMAPPSGLAWPADWAGQHLVVAAEQAQVLLRGWNAMRQIRDEALGEVAQRHAAAAQRFRAVRPAGDVLALQAEFLRRDVDAAARCMQQLTATALETGAEMLACTTHLINTQDAFEATTRLVHA